LPLSGTLRQGIEGKGAVVAAKNKNKAQRITRCRAGHCTGSRGAEPDIAPRCNVREEVEILLRNKKGISKQPIPVGFWEGCVPLKDLVDDGHAGTGIIRTSLATHHRS
jgi:hypothetical protein